MLQLVPISHTQTHTHTHTHTQDRHTCARTHTHARTHAHTHTHTHTHTHAHTCTHKHTQTQNRQLIFHGPIKGICSRWIFANFMDVAPPLGQQIPINPIPSYCIGAKWGLASYSCSSHAIACGRNPIIRGALSW